MVMKRTGNGKENGYTMKQIADELGVNKMKVYRTITKNHIKEHHKNGQTLYFDEMGKNGIEDIIKNQTTKKNQFKNNGVNKKNGENLIISLNDRIKSQKEQINNLTRLLDQSQQLQLMNVKKIEKLEANTNLLKLNKGNKNSAKNKDATRNKKVHKNFWKRLFG